MEDKIKALVKELFDSGMTPELLKAQVSCLEEDVE